MLCCFFAQRFEAQRVERAWDEVARVGRSALRDRCEAGSIVSPN
jgi:hypothetical protein